ncbi:hypothetical protein D3C72_1623150 [compost metagenome]
MTTPGPLHGLHNGHTKETGYRHAGSAGGDLAVRLPRPALYGHRRLFGRRAGARRRLSSGLHLRPVRQSRLARRGFPQHHADRPARRLPLPDRRLSGRLLPGDQGQSAIPVAARFAGRRALLDQPSGAHLCLDVHPRLARYPEPAFDDRHRGRAAAEHAGRSPARHRLRLPAADDHADLCEPGKARPSPA